VTLELNRPGYRPPAHEGPAVIFDCDGTLVDVTGIRHHVIRRPKNYDAFHYGSVFCPPIAWVLDEVDYHHRAGNRILVVTAREERWRTLTENWLATHGVPFHELHMRATGDFRSDVLIKGEILDRLIPRFDIRHAYDDNPSIIGLWKARGVPHTVVPGWASEDDE
jgi:phosphoglycolate phosphatase-like HAD superfamily hydrolase